jgi:hypothetical protein
MTWRFFHKVLFSSGVRAVGLAFLILASMGCGPKEAPLSEAAQTFKSKILEEVNFLGPSLVQSVAKKDVKAINRALAASFERAEKSGAPLPFNVFILDVNGVILARHPLEDKPASRFSDYRGVKEVIKTKRISSGILYFADGSKAYLVLAPLLSQDKLVGMMALALKADEAEEKWNLSLEDFKDINFNL